MDCNLFLPYSIRKLHDEIEFTTAWKEIIPAQPLHIKKQTRYLVIDIPGEWDFAKSKEYVINKDCTYKSLKKTIGFKKSDGTIVILDVQLIDNKGEVYEYRDVM